MPVETIDFFDLLWIKIAVAAAILALPLALIVGVIVIAVLVLSWVLDLEGTRKSRREAMHVAKLKRRRTQAREAFIASLPKTKSGNLFPKGKQLLAQYDRSN